MDGEPFDGATAKRLIVKILQAGAYAFTTHGEAEMLADGLARPDVLHVLRAGRISEPAEERAGTWRYRVRTRAALAVVAFRSASELVVVTAWRLRKR